MMKNEDPTSDPNLLGSKNGFRNLGINLDTRGNNTQNIYLDYFKALTSSTKSKKKN